MEHSGSQRGWISFQHYPNEKFIDFCMADSGIGILESYKRYIGVKNYSHITNYSDAMTAVIKGESTKHLDQRGYGVHTSCEMLIRGLKGTFIMLSGDVLLHNYDLIKTKSFINGTITVLRIPCNSFDVNFSFNKFVE